MTRTAVVLVSGGLDSTTCLALAQAEGFELVGVSFDYGQRHAVELEAARAVAAHFQLARHFVLEAGVFRAIGGSALTSEALAVPKGRSAAALAEGVPVTYVPARNLVFLSQAVAVAEVVGAEAVFIGVNALDYSGYPDCRPEFIEAFERAAQRATRAGLEGQGVVIRAPLLRWTKAEIVRQGVALGAPLHLTRSCYDPSAAGVSCGRCDACLLRIKGFQEAGAVDPVPYAVPVDWAAGQP